MTRMADRRLRLVLALSLAAFAVVVLRAAQIQVVDAAALSKKAVSQQRDVRRLPGLRGAILSANGQHLLRILGVVVGAAVYGGNGGKQIGVRV